MVDSSDYQRFQESRNEFIKILNNSELNRVPIAVLGNKIDIIGAVDEMELRMTFGLA